MLDNLARQKAVLRCDVSFDIEEAEHAVRVFMGQHQARQPAHRMPRQVEFPDTQGVAGGQGHLDQKRDRQRAWIAQLGPAAPGCVPEDQGASLEFGPQGEVRIVLFRGPEPMQAHKRCQGPTALQTPQANVGAIDSQIENARFQFGLKSLFDANLRYM